LAVAENSPESRQKFSKKASRSVFTSNTVVSPDPLSPTPSQSSAAKTPDLQFHSPSASLAKSEETPENTDGDPDIPKPHLEEISKCHTALISCAAQI
jgi:hypothetical protein